MFSCPVFLGTLCVDIRATATFHAGNWPAMESSSWTSQRRAAASFVVRTHGNRANVRSSLPPVGDFCRTIDFNYANGAIVKCLFYKLGMYPCTIGKILPRLFFDSSNSISLVLARGVRCSSFFFSFLLSYQPFLSCPL